VRIFSSAYSQLVSPLTKGTVNQNLVDTDATARVLDDCQADDDDPFIDDEAEARDEAPFRDDFVVDDIGDGRYGGVSELEAKRRDKERRQKRVRPTTHSRTEPQPQRKSPKPSSQALPGGSRLLQEVISSITGKAANAPQPARRILLHTDENSSDEPQLTEPGSTSEDGPASPSFYARVMLNDASIPLEKSIQCRKGQTVDILIQKYLEKIKAKAEEVVASCVSMSGHDVDMTDEVMRDQNYVVTAKCTPEFRYKASCKEENSAIMAAVRALPSEKGKLIISRSRLRASDMQELDKALELYDLSGLELSHSSLGTMVIRHCRTRLIEIV
jgi:hypothetical protein